MKLIKPARVVIAGIAIAVIAVVPAGGVASATTVPFTDQNAHGYIGLCNSSGHPITSGSTLDDPFVWTAVASTPAPSGYAQSKATLYVFQPRKDVDPGEWSGEQVTGSSTFTNPNHPMAQATSLDAPLISVDGSYPPEWNGLYQLRMYFTGANLEPYTQTYPSTVIQVSGNRWTVVQGGTAACNSGKATSNEVVELNRPSLRTPQSVVVTPGTVRGAANTGQAGAPPYTSSSSLGGTAGARSANDGRQPGGPHGVSASAPLGVNPGKGGGMSAGSIAAIALIAMAVLAGGGAGLTLWRRRTAGHGGGGPVPTGL